jgi:fermentation-respiration switch protein FrsA (DUF1100 family)
VRRLGVALFALYVCSAVVLVLFEEALLRWQSRAGLVHGSGADVWLRTEDGVGIYARYYERDPKLPVLLYLHGGAGTLASRSDRLELFASLGANLLAVEYRGYGPSEGTASARGLERDASAAYAWLRQRTAADKIVPFGESLGGGPATWLASSRRVGGLILLSTFTSTPELVGRFMPWLPAQLLVRTRFDNLRPLKHVTVPKLFIHSRTDEVVPFDMAEALWTAAPAPKRHLWLHGVGHNETFYQARTQATRALREFLSAL